MTPTLKLARKAWEAIKSNLEDRSVLELGSVDEDLLEEIDREQMQIIANVIARVPATGERE